MISLKIFKEDYMEKTSEKRTEETKRNLQQAKAIEALNRLREATEERGFMSDEEINTAIREARNSRVD